MPLGLPSWRARRIAREAARWRVEMLDSRGGEADDRFRAWLRADPDHARAYDELGKIATLAERSTHRPDRSAGTRPDPAFLRPVWGIACAVALLLAAGVFVVGRPQEPAFAAVVNSGPFIRSVRLADGSIVTLDIGAALDVATPPGREARLREGRARFKVQADAGGPFVVTSAAGRIAADSAEFDVALTPSGMTVVALAGLVEVSPAGDAGGASLTPVRPVAQIANGNIVSLNGRIDDRLWPASRLSFDRVPLDRLVTKANALATPPIRLADAELGRLEVTAVLDLRDTRSLARKLAAALDLRATEVQGEIQLSR